MTSESTNLSCASDGLMGYRTERRRIANRGMRSTSPTPYSGEQKLHPSRPGRVHRWPGVYRTGMSKVGVPGVDIGWAAEDPTIAELLKPLGYATADSAKNHFGDLSKPTDGARVSTSSSAASTTSTPRRSGELTDYPHADPIPRLRFRAAAGVQSARPPPRCPPWTPEVRSRRQSEPSGHRPAERKRMETIDDDITSATIDYIKRQRNADKPWFVDEHHAHAPVHPHQTGGAAGRGPGCGRSAYHDDDRPTAMSAPCWTAWANSALPRTPSSSTPPTMAHTATPGPTAAPRRSAAREGHQLEGAFPRAGDDPWPGKITAGAVSNERSSSTTTIADLLAAAGEPDIVERLKKAIPPARTATPSTRSISTVTTCSPTDGRGRRQPARGVLLLLRRRRSGGNAVSRTGKRCSWSSAAGHLRVWASRSRCSGACCSISAPTPMSSPTSSNTLRMVDAARLLHLLYDGNGGSSSTRSRVSAGHPPASFSVDQAVEKLHQFLAHD